MVTMSSFILVCFFLFVLMDRSAAAAYPYEEEAASIPGTIQSRQRARSWLTSVRDGRWGWGADTHRALVALYFANQSHCITCDLNDMLTLKELEIQLSLELWRHYHEATNRSGQMALFVHALLATCQDPKHFHDTDLTARLTSAYSDKMTFQYALTSLARCNMGHPIHSRHKYLLEYFQMPERGHAIDAKAMALMALSCSLHGEQNHMMNYFLRESAKVLKKLQQKDGSFGNVYTTAAVMQALISLGDRGKGWNFTKGVTFLLGRQQADGSFGDVLATYLSLPVLSGQSLNNLRHVKCSTATREARIVGHVDTADEDAYEQAENATVAEDVTAMSVNYSLWIGEGEDKAVLNSTQVSALPNSTVFQLMQAASKTYGEPFRFEFKTYTWGHFVTKLAGISEDPQNHKYWTLYVVDEHGVVNLAKQGISQLRVKDGDGIIFWYRAMKM